MIRHAAAVVVALCLSTSPLHAQSNTVNLTVRAASANVHKTPSMGSPVIGKAPKGTALVVTREIGDWVRVSWPSSTEGFGYVRVSNGTIARGGAAAPAVAAKGSGAAPVTAKAGAASTAAPAPIPAKAAQVPTNRPAAPTPARTIYVAPTHTVGFGAVAGGSQMGYGATARAWSKKRFGMQLEFSRFSYDSIDMLSRASSTDIAPSVLYQMRDKVSDTLWLRPYVGVAAHFTHSSRTDLILPDVTESANTLGARFFGGGEFSFSAVPQLAVSADVGYYHLPQPFVGFEPGGMGFSLSAIWYMK